MIKFYLPCNASKFNSEKFKNAFMVGSLGTYKRLILSKVDKSFLEDTQFEVYTYDTNEYNINSSNIKKHLNEFVDEGFLYENIFGKKYYCSDQLLSENIRPVNDLQTYYSTIYEITRASLLSDDLFIKNIDDNYVDKDGNFIMNESTGLRTLSRPHNYFTPMERQIISDGGL